MTIYEQIKEMTLEEMAEHHALIERSIYDAFKGISARKGVLLNFEVPDIEVSKQYYKNWLESDG